MSEVTLQRVMPVSSSKQEEYWRLHLSGWRREVAVVRRAGDSGPGDSSDLCVWQKRDSVVSTESNCEAGWPHNSAACPG